MTFLSWGDLATSDFIEFKQKPFNGYTITRTYLNDKLINQKLQLDISYSLIGNLNISSPNVVVVPNNWDFL